MSCQAINDLLLLCKRIEQQLNQDEKSIMSKLKPRFFLIGSVAEGTRMYRASEADFTTQFRGLHEFSVGEDATELIAHDNDVKVLKAFINDKKVFNYPAFLKFFLEQLRIAIEELERNEEIPQSFKKLNLYHVPCENCKKEMKHIFIFQPFQSCKDCLPTICHTKLGPCLAFHWMFDESNGWVMTADLVPIFQVKGKPMDLFNRVMTTLLDKNPPGWRNYTFSLFKRDIILPEVFKLHEKNSNEDQQEVTIKILNYGNQNNFIIRPAQEMKVQVFQTNSILRQAYIHIKALKMVLGTDAKSYMVKKVLLLPQFDSLVTEGEKLTSETQRRQCWMNLVYDVLNYPDLKKEFRKRIDYDKWTREDRNIPLLWK